MTGAVLYHLPVLAAALAGLVFGFGRHWESACLAACLWIPLATSAIYAAVYVPTLAGALFWGLIVFLGEILATFMVWGISAGVHYGTYKLWRRFS
jgi:hypothetical protein